MKFSEETKKKMSEKRKEWFRKNPDRHPWRSGNKFKSEPCEKVKEFLTKLNIKFIAEFQPNVEGRFFSIDIAMPDKLIALEVNGNQHYNRDGSLKPYYQERHDLLEKHGWTVYEIHYSACFNLEKWREFFSKIELSDVKVDFDYFTYKPIEPFWKKRKCPNCDNLKVATSALCMSCSFKLRRENFKKDGFKYPEAPKPPRESKSKTQKPQKDTCPQCGNLKSISSKICKACNFPCVWPTPLEMKDWLWKESTVKIAAKLGVSDKAVERFCKFNKLEKPPRGHWAKVRAAERRKNSGGMGEEI